MKRVKKKYQTPVIHSIELGPISPVTASPGGGVTIPGGGNASGGGAIERVYAGFRCKHKAEVCLRQISGGFCIDNRLQIGAASRYKNGYV